MHRVAVVTGAAGVIGRAIADRLGALGLEVARVDRAPADDAGSFRADVSRPDDVDGLCERIESRLGRVDLLVNAAGVYGPRAPFLSCDPASWWDVWATNVGGPSWLCRRLVPGMVDRGSGLVVNISSRAAVWDDPGASSVAYSTSKAALVRFTQALAAEIAGTGVMVVDVSPGFVRSGMTGSRPDIDDLPISAFQPPATVASTVALLAGGGYEDLHGHFVHATDDLDDLLAHVRADPAVRTLGLTPFAGDDPVA